MKCLVLCILLSLPVLAGHALASPNDQDDRQTIVFHGIRASDPAGKSGLRNPERGFRGETQIALSNDEAWASRIDRENDGMLTLVQCYCYLLNFVGTDISAGKLDQLQASFDTLRRHGAKAVLRFAYESERDGKVGPTLDDIHRHIRQLQPLLEKNVGVIHVLQAGMIGLWGEWHHSVHGLDRDPEAQKQIVADLLDALPKERMIQLRRASYKRTIFGPDGLVTEATAHDGSPVSRVGFHHDFFVVCPNSWDSSPGTQDFDQVCRESPYVMVDGEMPWGNEAGAIDGMGAILRLRVHRYTSFSIAHNFHEGGHDYALVQWQKTPLTLEQVRENHLPIDEGYFEDEQTRSISRSIFEYIRDHLGYRIELQKADLPRTMRASEPLHMSVSLINRGFSAPQNPRQVLFVLTSEEGGTIELPTTADPRLWQPFEPGDANFRPLQHKINLSLPMGLSQLRPGKYQIGLWLPDTDLALRRDSRYAIRFANRDVPWLADAGKPGFNMLGSLQVLP